MVNIIRLYLGDWKQSFIKGLCIGNFSIQSFYTIKLRIYNRLHCVCVSGFWSLVSENTFDIVYVFTLAYTYICHKYGYYI